MRERIFEELKTAMKQKQPVRIATLRLVVAAIKERDIAARGGEDGGGVSDDDVLTLLAKMIKQREESVTVYERGGRLELAERERDEIAVIREFLPTPLTQAETDAAVAAAIEKTGASSLKDMGAVMGVLKAEYTGRIDFAKTGKAVKARLAGA